MWPFSSEEKHTKILQWEAELGDLESEPGFVMHGSGWYLTDRGVRKVTGCALGGTSYGHPLSTHFYMGNWSYNIKGQPLRGSPRVLAEIKPEDLAKYPMSAAMRVMLCIDYPEHHKLNHQQAAGINTLLRILLDAEQDGESSMNHAAQLAAHANSQFRSGLDAKHCESLCRFHDGKEWWELQGNPVSATARGEGK